MSKIYVLNVACSRDAAQFQFGAQYADRTDAMENRARLLERWQTETDRYAVHVIKHDLGTVHYRPADIVTIALVEIAQEPQKPGGQLFQLPHGAIPHDQLRS